MESGRQIIEDVRMWANEYHMTTPSGAARSAAGALAELHPDMPEVVGLGSDMLRKMKIDAPMSRTTSRRLADAVVRETLNAGPAKMDNPQRLEVVRRSLINVLIQEAAGREIERRGGVDPARRLDRDPDTRGHGEIAAAVLRRNGIDSAELFSSMTEYDLARTSQGAYDKVSLIAHGPLSKALEAGSTIMTKDQVAMNRAINPEQAAADRVEPRMANNPLRHLAPPAPRRMPSFGRRMAHAHAIAGGNAL